LGEVKILSIILQVDDIMNITPYGIRFEFISCNNKTSMFKNYLLIAFRSILRGKFYSLINIVGLAIGIASCVLILLFISHELSFDRYHEKANRTFRLYISGNFGDNVIKSSKTAAPIKDALEQDISEIEHVTRLLQTIRPVVRYYENSFVEDDFFYTDSSFFDTFSVKFIQGDPKSALNKPNALVITEEMAKKYFGNLNPIGMVISVNQFEMEITAVTEKMPSNSHFQYNFLASITTMGVDKWRSWLSSNLFTYVVLKPNVNPEEIYHKVNDLTLKYLGPEVQQVMGVDLNAFEEMGNSFGFFFEPITDIHLRSNLDHQLSKGGNIAYIYFFSTIAVFLLLIACINFMNMATAKYTNRAKEVGVRKVVGSTKRNLVFQFLVESILVSFIAVIIAMTLVELVLPLFNNLAGKDLSLSYFTSWTVLPSLLVFGLIVGVIAGSYPAFFLSSFKPIKVLKGQISSGVKGVRFRGALVVLQFAITITLFISTFVVNSQLAYFKSRDLGFEKEGVLVLKRTHTLGDKHATFREEILKSTDIVNASFCDAIPGYDFNGTTISLEGRPMEEMVHTGFIRVDEYYFETLGIGIESGRFFSSDFGTDDEVIVINEKLVELCGLKDPIGKRLMVPYLTGDKLVSAEIIGIVPNVFYESLHREVRGMTYAKETGVGWLMAIRYNSNDIGQTIKFIESKWNEFNPNQPLLYSFLDNDLNQLYSEEERTSKIFSIFSILAIFIACLGLLGMASFSAEKRTKEIGVRKVLGANNQSIFVLLSKQVVILVLVASMFAIPASWLAMQNWLSNFAYRIDMELWMFALGVILAFLIAILTISYQAIRVATQNPINSLKYE
jgi:putative ABC transport system permease protein